MRIEIPVKSITSAILESKSLIRSGNIGAIARGPIACMKVAAVTHVKAENFQKLLQLSTTNSVSNYVDNRGVAGFSNIPRGHADHHLAEEPGLDRKKQKI